MSMPDEACGRALSGLCHRLTRTITFGISGVTNTLGSRSAFWRRTGRRRGPIAEDYLLKDYLADVRNQNVVKSVHVECGWDPSNPVGETEWLQGIADKHGFPHGIVARATLDAPDVEQVLEGHARHKNVRGIRHAVNWHPDPAKTYVNRPDLIRTEAWRGVGCSAVWPLL